MLVTGSGSSWRSASKLVVGGSGSGNILTLSDSGVVAATNLLVGEVAGSSGNMLTVSGGLLDATNSAGTGALEVRNGALIVNSGTVVADRFVATNGANSVVRFNGGVLTSGGALVNNGAAFTIGDGAQSAAYNMRGGTHTFVNDVIVSIKSTLGGSGNATIIGNVNDYGALSVSHSSTVAVSGNLMLGPSGVLAVRASDETLVMRGNFVNGSTNNMGYDTKGGTIVFGGSTPLTGPGAATNSFEVVGVNMGRTFKGFDNNFAVGTLKIVNNITFVNQINNGGGLGTNESLYVDVLHLYAGASLDLSELTLYVGSIFMEDNSGRIITGGEINEKNIKQYGLVNVFLENGGEIVFVPEPGSAALLLCGLAGLLGRRRARRAERKSAGSRH